MPQNQNIPVYITNSTGGMRPCTVPSTYRAYMPGQIRPSCGFYAAAYVLNCFHANPEWNDLSLFQESTRYPNANSREGKLSVIGEIFEPREFTNFINSCSRGTCTAACQPFRAQTILNTIRHDGYILVPFQVTSDEQNSGNERNGFPKINVQPNDTPHAHWCVVAGHLAENENSLLAKHWGKNHLFDIDELSNSNSGIHPVHTHPGLSTDRAAEVVHLQGCIITVLPAGNGDNNTPARHGCSC